MRCLHLVISTDSKNLFRRNQKFSQLFSSCVLKLESHHHFRLLLIFQRDQLIPFLKAIV